MTWAVSLFLLARDVHVTPGQTLLEIILCLFGQLRPFKLCLASSTFKHLLSSTYT